MIRAPVVLLGLDQGAEGVAPGKIKAPWVSLEHHRRRPDHHRSDTTPAVIEVHPPRGRLDHARATLRPP
jgi:hypothetical protein